MIEIEGTEYQEMNKQNKLENLIKKSVEAIPDNIHTAIAVSGGIDSNLLQALGKYKNTITVVLPFGNRYDEKVNAKTKVALDLFTFKEDLVKAIKIIGTPIPHFNIYPFYKMCERLWQDGITDLIVGDGPDESMCGYTRHLIMDHLYGSYVLTPFKEYSPTISKILPTPQEAYSRLIGKDEVIVSSLMNTGTLVKDMCNVDMKLMRPDMSIMTNKLAGSFGITIHRPYEEPEIDNMMFNLEKKDKIHYPWGKFLLRKISEKYLPESVTWNTHKIGGPLVPVNKLMGWNTEEFDKSMYLRFQKEVLGL
jgi:asparagine synthetase B (glutamine-hydrolysing)